MGTMKKFLFFLVFLVSCQSKDMEKINPIDAYFDLNLNSGADHEALVQEYVDLLNFYRTSQGLKPLTYSSEIAHEAELHSADMGSGVTPLGYEGNEERCGHLKDSLKTVVLCGEIVARGSGDPEKVLNSWLKSAAHKAYLLNEHYSHTGVGVSKGPQGEAYWTQIFIEVTE